MIRSISSSQNPAFKELKKLRTGASKLNEGKLLLEGIHLSQVFLQHHNPILCLVSEHYAQEPELRALVAVCQAKNVEIIALKNHLFESLSSYKNESGILLVAETPSLAPPTVLKSNAILIDRLQDPGNLGTIIRTAAAVDMKHIYCSKNTVSAWSPKVLRAAVGAHFTVSIYQNIDLAEVIQASEVPVIATTPHTDATIYQTDLSKPTAWLIGQEGQGAEESLMELCSIKASIPHSSKVESLNAATATAICLFEQYRQSIL
jgi:TrmH family RNA methyltransferase